MDFLSNFFFKFFIAVQIFLSKWGEKENAFMQDTFLKCDLLYECCMSAVCLKKDRYNHLQCEIT